MTYKEWRQNISIKLEDRCTFFTQIFRPGILLVMAFCAWCASATFSLSDVAHLLAVNPDKLFKLDVTSAITSSGLTAVALLAILSVFFACIKGWDILNLLLFFAEWVAIWLGYRTASMIPIESSVGIVAYHTLLGLFFSIALCLWVDRIGWKLINRKIGK